MLHFFSRGLRAASKLKEAKRKVAVAVGVLVEVVLMVFLGRIETVERQHLGDDGLEVALGFLRHSFLNHWQIGRLGIVDACAVLWTHVMALLVLERGVDGIEIHVEQELEPYLLGVIDHSHGLGMPCLVGAHLLITWILYCAVGISHLSVDHTVNQFEKMLCTSKATSCQINFSCHNRSVLF